MDTRALLIEREKTNGSYAVQAATSQGIKSVMYSNQSMTRLSDMQRESLEMVAHKIGRILAGDPNHEDHWRDIAGYATLVAMALEKR